jgi:hypothetical protein
LTNNVLDQGFAAKNPFRPEKYSQAVPPQNK